MEENTCFQYLKSISDITDERYIIEIFSTLVQADPDPNFKNCNWIIDSYINGDFSIEDVLIVKDEILKFQKFFGIRRPFPSSGYSELKVMNSEKEKKLIKTKDKTKQNVVFTINDCKKYFNNVKNNLLPIEYKNVDYENKELYLKNLFQIIQDINPTTDLKNCIWIIEEIKSWPYTLLRMD